ncbi:hypothetical protein [Fibrobacter sp.]
MLTLRQAHEWLAEFVSDFDAGKRLPLPPLPRRLVEVLKTAVL